MVKSIAGGSLKADLLVRRMAALKIFEKDLEEGFVMSPGSGGQNVNKVATCVVLKHIPSGQVVKCHKYRTQFANRLFARELLLNRLQGLALKRHEDISQVKFKARAQSRRRSVRGKELTLDQKRRRSDQKQSRRKIYGQAEAES